MPRMATHKASKDWMGMWQSIYSHVGVDQDRRQNDGARGGDDAWL
jgi:hypothetical protein